MRAVTFVAPGVVEVADVAEPELAAPTDALVRVVRAAICGSDLHFLHGKAPATAGQILGHEAVGVVTATGDDVRSVAVGARVVVSFAVACGRCWFCRHGETNLCDEAAVFGAGPFGGDLPGTQAELVRVPWADVNLLALPDDIDDDRAVFVGDVLTTGYHAATLARPAPGAVAAVVGAGPLGWSVAASLRAHGLERVFLLDREPDRLRLAEAAGAMPIHVGERSAESVLAEATDDRGADVTVDAVGAPDAYASAISLARRGGRIVVAGVYAGEAVELQLGVAWARALEVRYTGICPVHAHWRTVLGLVRTGALDPSVLVDDRVDLDQAPAAYARFDRRLVTKVLIEP